MRDLTPGKNQGPSPSAAPDSTKPAFVFKGLDVDDDDPIVSSLKGAIAGMLAPRGVRSISFDEPDDTTDARVRIRGQESTYLHVSDGTVHGCLCGYTARTFAPSGAPECPVCALLDG